MKRLASAFSFIFSDNEWFNKVLIGGLYFLLIPFGIGMVMLNGYLVDFIDRKKNDEKGMPYWRYARMIFQKGIKRSLFALLSLATVYAAVFGGNLVFTIPASILLLSLFFTINCIQITRTFDFFAAALSMILLIIAISIGWMWIVVGWPLLIFLALLVQTHLFTQSKSE
ncbi:MAG: hypothetical protein WCW35_00675 [Bacteroidota bacterium]